MLKYKFVLLFVLGIFLIGCENGGTTNGSVAADGVDTVATDTSKKGEKLSLEELLEVLSPMKSFVLGLEARSMSRVKEVFSTEAVDDNEFWTYQFEKPHFMELDENCYRFEAKAGNTLRIYKICFEGKKIIKMEFKGLSE